MSLTALEIFKKAHKRAEEFFISGNKGPKNKDSLRAAVLFEVAAIDAYFHCKIIAYVKKQREKNTNYRLSTSAQKLIQEVIARENFRKDYKDLDKKQKELVNLTANSNQLSVIDYLDRAIQYESFQSVDKITEAFKLFDRTPSEVWGRFDSSVKLKTIVKQKKGRPKKSKVGRKIDAKTQLTNLFKKRHLIAHEADIILRGRKSLGAERKINFADVKKWLNATDRAISEIDKIIQ